MVSTTLPQMTSHSANPMPGKKDEVMRSPLDMTRGEFEAFLNKARQRKLETAD